MPRLLVFVLALSASGCWNHTTKKAEPPAKVEDAPPTGPIRWAHIGESSTIGDVKVTLLSVRLAKYQFRSKGGVSESNDESIIVAIGIENLSGKKKLTYSTYRMREGVSLKDEHGNEYFVRQRDASEGRIVGGSNGAELQAANTLEDLLTFKRPVDEAKTFRLTLPPIEGNGLFRFEFTRDDLKP
jgi:hypothetical protein